MYKSTSTSYKGQRRPAQAGQSRRNCLIIIPLAGGILFVLIAVILLLVLGLRQAFVQQASTDMPLEIVKLTPPAIPTAQPSPLPPPQQSCETIISSDDVQVAASLPVSLTLGGEPFPIVAIVSGEQGWTYPSGHTGAAAWVCGTVVNYVVGLEPTPENETTLIGLRPGDEIKMHLSSGTVLVFRFVERRETEANEASVFDQMRPRLTLVLEKQDGAWQVAEADYASEIEQIPPSTGTLTPPGQPVRVGDAQVTVTEGHVERDAADLLAGTMYYLVEFSVENVGIAPLDASAFNMQLQDDVGNIYLLSPTASEAGANGSLGGEIGTGSVMQGTAGYLVPETLVGPALIWTFSPRLGSALASVSIPYEASVEQPSVGERAEVTLDEDGTFLSSDGGNLVIGGQVHNVGEVPITVELSDISLTSSAGMSALVSNAPRLPWTLQPGETQVFELQYDTPAASTALLTLLGYSFEIRGVR